ncbi:MAG: EamA family transporter [Hyphomicrobiaceae bacterium]
MSIIPLILFTVLTNAIAQIMLKRGMLTIGPLDFSASSPVMTILKVVFQPFVFAGLCIFVVSMASHLYVLSKVELSFAYPFLSLAYVVVLAFAWLVFGEQVGPLRVAGVALICLGTVLVAQS